MIPHLAQSDIVTASYSISNTIYPKSTHRGLGMGKTFPYKMHFTLKLTLARDTCRSTDLICSSDFKAHKRSHFKSRLCLYDSTFPATDRGLHISTALEKDISYWSIGHRENFVLKLSPVFQIRSYYQILWVFTLPQHGNS